MSGKLRTGSTAIRRDLMDMAYELTFPELGLVGEKISPPLKVRNNAATYPVFPRENIGKVSSIERPPGGTFNRGKWEYDSDSYTTKLTGHEEEVELVNALENEDMFVDDEEVAAAMVAQKLKLGNESTVAADLFNETTFAGTGSTNPSATYFTAGTTGLLTVKNEMDDATNAAPYHIVDLAWRATLRPKTMLTKDSFSLVLSDDLINYMLRTDEVMNSVQYVEPIARMPRARKLEFLKDYLEVKEIIPVKSMYDVTDLGIDPSVFGKFWSNEYMLMAKLSDGRNTFKEQAVSRQPVWSKYANGGMKITEYAEPQNMKVVYQGSQYRGIITNADYGVLFKNMKTTVSSTTKI